MSNEQVENRVIDLNININIGHSDDSNDTRSPNISIIPTVESVDSTKTDEVSIKLNAEYVNEYDNAKEEDEQSESPNGSLIRCCRAYIESHYMIEI